MAINMKGESFISINDLSQEKIFQIFDLSSSLKYKAMTGEPHALLAGKTAWNDLFETFYQNARFI